MKKQKLLDMMNDQVVSFTILKTESTLPLSVDSIRNYEIEKFYRVFSDRKYKNEYFTDSLLEKANEYGFLNYGFRCWSFHQLWKYGIRFYPPFPYNLRTGKELGLKIYHLIKETEETGSKIFNPIKSYYILLIFICKKSVLSIEHITEIQNFNERYISWLSDTWRYLVNSDKGFYTAFKQQLKIM